MTNNKIEKTFAKHCDIITTVINKLSINSNHYSIYMYGGYGRDEGGWILEGEHIKPYNDYDILIVSDISKLTTFTKYSNQIRKKLLTLIDIQFIDILVINEIRFLFPKHTIFNVDLFFGSKLIQGKPRLAKYKSLYKQEDTNISDLISMFFTKSWIICAGINNNNDMVFEQSQLSKLIFACIDSYLIIRGLYNSSYKRRVEIFNTAPVDSKYKLIANWALKQRLRPNINKTTKKTIQEYKTIVTKYFHWCFLEAINLNYNKCYKDIYSFLLNAEKYVSELNNSKCISRLNRKRKTLKSLILGYGATYYTEPSNSELVHFKLRQLSNVIKISWSNVDNFLVEVAYS